MHIYWFKFIHLKENELLINALQGTGIRLKPQGSYKKFKLSVLDFQGKPGRQCHPNTADGVHIVNLGDMQGPELTKLDKVYDAGCQDLHTSAFTIAQGCWSRALTSPANINS